MSNQRYLISTGHGQSFTVQAASPERAAVHGAMKILDRCDVGASRCTGGSGAGYFQGYLTKTKAWVGEAFFVREGETDGN